MCGVREDWWPVQPPRPLRERAEDCEESQGMRGRRALLAALASTWLCFLGVVWLPLAGALAGEGRGTVYVL